MTNERLSFILSGFNDDYLSPMACLKLIDRTFLAFVTAESFYENTEREELSRQLLALQERLSVSLCLYGRTTGR